MNMKDHVAPARPKLSAELFMPPEGGIEEQLQRQIAFMTQGVMDCMVLANNFPELSGPEPEPPPPDVWGRRRPAEPPPDRRAQRLREAAHLSNATARLVAAYAKLRGEFHFTYSRVENVPGRRRKAVQHDGSGT
ncbi:MAG: hypothetical protein KGJ75_18160 [Alphaproteobacteria bacterium]|nr:hypothetical protein [Alphaproteobacteria bacterium]